MSTNFDNVRQKVPSELFDRDVWLFGGGPNGKNPGAVQGAAWQDCPKTWDALTESVPPNASTVGVVYGSRLPEFHFVDLDKVRDPDTGKTATGVRELVESCKGAYWEVSTSGTGLRGIVKGDLPPCVNTVKIKDRLGKEYGKGEIEIFCSQTRAKDGFLVLTGKQDDLCKEFSHRDALPRDKQAWHSYLEMLRAAEDFDNSMGQAGEDFNNSGKAREDFNNSGKPYAEQWEEPNKKQMAEWLLFNKFDCNDYQEWQSAVGPLKTAAGSWGYDLFHRWSSGYPDYDHAEADEKWNDRTVIPQGPGSLFSKANKRWPGWRDECNEALGLKSSKKEKQPPTAWKATCLGDVFDLWQEEGEMEHIPTGFPTLDEYLDGGIRPKTPVIITGMPEVNKTGTCIQMAAGLMRSEKALVGYVSIDSSEEEIYQRFAQRHSATREDLRKRDPAVMSRLLREMAPTVGEFFRCYGHDVETGKKPTVEQASLALQDEAEQRGLQPILFIDSLQTCPAHADEKQFGNTSAIERTARAVTAIQQACAQGVAVIAISEVSRANYSNSGDLDYSQKMGAGKNSSDIDYAAKVLINLTRPADPFAPDNVVQVELIKNKQGAGKGTLKPFYCEFDRETQSMYEASWTPESAEERAERHEDEASRLLPQLGKDIVEFCKTPSGRGLEETKKAVIPSKYAKDKVWKQAFKKAWDAAITTGGLIYSQGSKKACSKGYSSKCLKEAKELEAKQFCEERGITGLGAEIVGWLYMRPDHRGDAGQKFSRGNTAAYREAMESLPEGLISKSGASIQLNLDYRAAA